jgi:hypothetical protein
MIGLRDSGVIACVGPGQQLSMNVEWKLWYVFFCHKCVGYIGVPLYTTLYCTLVYLNSTVIPDFWDACLWTFHYCFYISG